MVSYLEWDEFLTQLSATPDNKLDFLLLISATIPENFIHTERKWLDEVIRALRSGGLLFIQGKPEELPSIGIYLDEWLTFKYWIAIESIPRQLRSGLPSTHAALLLFTKGKKFNIQKVRFPHKTCQACGKPLRDWGGKTHLMHPDGFVISDVWKDLPIQDNYNALSRPVLDVILKMVDNAEYQNGIIAPKNGLVPELILAPIQKMSVFESNMDYISRPKQFPLPGLLPSRQFETDQDGLWNKIIRGDVLEILKQYPDESVDLVFADPPYNLDKSYHTYEDEKDRDAYLDWCNEWLDEYIRILKPTGSLYLLNLPHWAMYHAQYLNQRLFFQNWIVWDALSEPRGKIMPAHYALLFYTRDESSFTFNYEEVAYLDSRNYCLRPACIRQRKIVGEDKKEMLTDIWWDIHRLKHRRDRDYHPCQLPEALMERIIRLSTNPGDVVLDGLAGTGTTAVVAAKLGRRYVAIDLDEEYIEITRQKIYQISTMGNIYRSSIKKPRKPYSKKALQLELQKLAQQLGRLPTPTDVQNLSQYGLDAFLTTFPTWGKALKAAKLEVTNDHSHP